MKMPNFLDYLFGLLISTLVFFIVLAVILFGVESNVNSDIKHKASKFVNESCVSGKWIFGFYKIYPQIWKL